MNTSMLIQLLGSRGKLATTAHGHKVVEAHIEGARKRFNDARGPTRDNLRHELNSMIYAYNKSRGL